MPATLRRILRRLKFVAPGLRTVGASGCQEEDLAAAASLEGWEVDQQTPEAWIAWQPEGGKLAIILPSSVEAAVVVSPHPQALLPHAAGSRPATGISTLREWVSSWPLAAVGKFLLAADAAGARACRLRLGGVTEAISLKKPEVERSIPPAAPLLEAIITMLGIGNFPIMPATLACAAMLVIALPLRPALGGDLFQSLCLLIAAASTLLGISLEKWARKHFLDGDPREFVLDEVAGQALAWCFLPAEGAWWLLPLGFLLFRFFDIWKFGVCWVEKLPVRGTVVWDDLLAGAYAGLVLLAVSYLPLF